MTYNVFSGTLNPTHFTSLHVSKMTYFVSSVHQILNESVTNDNWFHNTYQPVAVLESGEMDSLQLIIFRF